MKMLFLPLFLGFCLAISMLSPIVTADNTDPNNITCAIGDNLSTFPSPGTNITLAVPSNSTVSFNFNVLINGDCTAFNVSLITNCPWCTFSQAFFGNLSWHTNTAVSSAIFIPPFPSNLTNTTYYFDINVTALNATTKGFQLQVYVPYTNQYDNTTVLIAGTNWTLQNITDIISQLSQTDQLKLALILSQVFGNQFNFSFVVRSHDVVQQTVPVVSVLPISVEEYLREQQSCNPLVYTEAQSRAKAAESALASVQNTTNTQQSLILDLQGNLNTMTEKYTSCVENSNETIQQGLLQARQQTNDNNTTFAIAFLIVAGAAIYYIYNKKYHVKGGKVKPPGRSGIPEEETEDPAPKISIGKLRNVMQKKDDAIQNDTVQKISNPINDRLEAIRRKHMGGM